jgi:hypothetical protein
MAALGAISLVATAVGAVAPLIPGIVQAVEGWFGHSSTATVKAGPDKMNTAVSILQGVLTALANAGKIPSAPVTDPSLPAGLAGAVQQAVDAAKARGELGASANDGVQSLASGAQSLTPPVSVVLQTGQRLLISA